jgi:ribosomal protein S18 acetylase RimI-like enzyme
LFWQSIPFLDLLYIDEAYQGKGYGRQMMAHWESAMQAMGYKYVMLSTQEDETAKYFYEKLGYRRIGAFLPPEQDADEIMYLKTLE